ncbi:MAG: SDR family oxidoreductase [Chloroflexota bacterium]|nr:SDR family oxidoreductase [Chloroflexota bacterium]
MRFQDKVAIITAAASGIGKATSRILASEGAHVVAVDVNTQALAALVDTIESTGGNISSIEANVLESQPVEEFVDSVVSTFNRIDILVNAVGGSTIIQNSAASVDNLTLDDWDKVIQFNLRGTFLCTKAIIKQMKKQGNGKIVNISSDAAHSLGDPSSAYVAAKAGIMAFTKKVAREAGPYGVTCNAIAPGTTLSERVGPRWEQRSEENKQQILEGIPLRRVAQPEDQAKVIAFLASGDADYVTGVTIDTSGGRY